MAIVCSFTAFVVVFVVLCFLIVLMKTCFDYNRYKNEHKNFITKYRSKLSDFAKVGAAIVGAGIGAAALKDNSEKRYDFPMLYSSAESSREKRHPQQRKLLKPSSSRKLSELGEKESEVPPNKIGWGWIGGTPTSEMKGGNNCLFDASIESCRLIDEKTGKSFNSQELREMCDKVLKDQNFPTIPNGEPAGEQYLQALSFVLKKKIKIYKGNRETFVAEIRHSDIDEKSNSFSIVHVGPQLNGHWVAF